MKKINTRLPDDIHKAMKESAEVNRRSLNGEILHALDFYIHLGAKTPPINTEREKKEKEKGM